MFLFYKCIIIFSAVSLMRHQRQLKRFLHSTPAAFARVVRLSAALLIHFNQVGLAFLCQLNHECVIIP